MIFSSGLVKFLRKSFHANEKPLNGFFLFPVGDSVESICLELYFVVSSETRMQWFLVISFKKDVREKKKLNYFLR